MRNLLLRLLMTAFVAVMIMPAFAQSGSDAILGVWYNTEKSAKVEIYKCEDQYCGKIVWLKDPKNEAGEPKKDVNNPEEELQERSVLGMNLLASFNYTGDNQWEDGTIYDPENGKTYSCIMSLKDNGELKVRGYIGFSLMGRTVIWTRAE